MNNKIINTIKRYNMLSENDRVLLAVSGGADSMALLSFFYENKDEFNIDLSVAHVEHGIRGEESLRDMNFVKTWCDERKIPFHLLQVDVIKEAKRLSIGIEECARKKRYEFFDSLSYDKIVTAHTLSDNIETVLFRLARGTSLKGVCGIPVVRGNIIRPMIDCTRSDVLEYCSLNKISFVTDSTNKSNDYSRNYIRHNIVPAFKELNPSFEKAISRFIENVKLENDLLDGYARDAIQRALNSDESLNLIAIADLDESVYKRVIHKYFNVVFDIYLDDLHLNSIYEICKNTGKSQVNENITAIANNKILRVIKETKKVDFSKIIIDCKITQYEEFVNNEKKSCEKIDFYCDYDKIIGNVVVRSRQAGDKIKLANRRISKSLKKLFNEKEIPVEDRENIPVLIDDLGVIGVFGFEVDERVKINSTTKRILQIKLR